MSLQKEKLKLQENQRLAQGHRASSPQSTTDHILLVLVQGQVHLVTFSPYKSKYSCGYLLVLSRDWEHIFLMKIMRFCTLFHESNEILYLNLCEVCGMYKTNTGRKVLSGERSSGDNVNIGSRICFSVFYVCF